MTGTHDRSKLELHPRGVERGQTHEALDHRDLALVHHQHGDELDADEERVQEVGAVEQWIVLQADAASCIDEGLEVLIVVVEHVLRSEQHVDQLSVGDPRVGFLERSHIVEAAEPRGDVALVEGCALQRGDEADDVAVALRRDHDNLQLLGGEPEGLGRQGAAPSKGRQLR